MNDTNGSRRKLHIAMVCDPITDYTAGVFISTRRFAERLKEKGHKIVFIAARSPKSPRDNYYKGIKVYRFFSFLLPKSEGSFYISLPSPKKIKKIFLDEKIDIVHVLLPTPSSVVSVKAARTLGIKVVAHSHAQPENIFLHLPKGLIFISGLLSRIYYQYLSWLYRQADAIIFPTEFAKELFSSLNGGIKKAVISNGIDTQEFKPADPASFLNEFHIPSEKKRILFVGRLHPEKSIDTLIKSMKYVAARLPEANTYIVGSGHQEDELKQLTFSLGLGDRVIFLGRISDEDLMLAYNSCDVFVLPSLAELEGMVVLEAMACGKPIVVANAKDSAARYFVDQNGLLFEPENEKDLAEKLIQILGNDGMRKKMGEASLVKSKDYDINESVSKLENMYYSILNN